MRKLILTKNQYKTLLESLNQEPIVKGGLDRVDDMAKKYNLKEEYKNLLEYLYGKSKNLSEFWNECSVNYESILEGLKDILVKEKDGYKLSKKLGSPQDALKIYEERLNEIVGGITEGDWFDNHPDNPINQEPNKFPRPTAQESDIDIKYNNGEIAIVSSGDEQLLFDLDDYNSEFMKAVSGDESELSSIATELGYADDNKDGYWTNNDEQSKQVLKNYIESNSDKLKPITDEVKNDLLDFYSHDEELINALSGDEEQSLNELHGESNDAYIERKTKEFIAKGKSPEEAKRLAISLNTRRSITGDHETVFGGAKPKKELTKKTIQSKNPPSTQTRLPFDETMSLGGVGGGVSVFGGGKSGERLNMPVGKYNEPLKKTFKEGINETTQGEGSIGTYDANALSIGRNGEFNKGEQPRAFKEPQWAGGTFPQQPECSKPNNNKEAQNGGCNSGASSLKLKKAKGSVNAPSLGENKIYETIAKKTGKTIDEVKRIIESKNNK